MQSHQCVQAVIHVFLNFIFYPLYFFLLWNMCMSHCTHASRFILSHSALECMYKLSYMCFMCLFYLFPFRTHVQAILQVFLMFNFLYFSLFLPQNACMSDCTCLLIFFKKCMYVSSFKLLSKYQYICHKKSNTCVKTSI